MESISLSKLEFGTETVGWQGVALDDGGRWGGWGVRKWWYHFQIGDFSGVLAALDLLYAPLLSRRPTRPVHTVICTRFWSWVVQLLLIPYKDTGSRNDSVANLLFSSFWAYVRALVVSLHPAHRFLRLALAAWWYIARRCVAGGLVALRFGRWLFLHLFVHEDGVDRKAVLGLSIRWFKILSFNLILTGFVPPDEIFQLCKDFVPSSNFFEEQQLA